MEIQIYQNLLRLKRDVLTRWTRLEASEIKAGQADVWSQGSVDNRNVETFGWFHAPIISELNMLCCSSWTWHRGNGLLRYLAKVSWCWLSRLLYWRCLLVIFWTQIHWQVQLRVRFRYHILQGEMYGELKFFSKKTIKIKFKKKKKRR